jgi:hypothetical protein
VAHFRVIASEAVFGVNFLAISVETSRSAQQLTNLFMFPYQKGGPQPKKFPPGHTIRRALASRTTTLATVTNHLVRCSRSVIIPPYVVLRASLLGRRTYLNARYSTTVVERGGVRATFCKRVPTVKGSFRLLNVPRASVNGQ